MLSLFLLLLFLDSHLVIIRESDILYDGIISSLNDNNTNNNDNNNDNNNSSTNNKSRTNNNESSNKNSILAIFYPPLK